MADNEMALLGVCEHAREPQLGDAIFQAVEVGQSLRPVQEVIGRRLAEGLVLRSDAVAHVLAAGLSKSLWEAGWPLVRDSIWSTLLLYQAQHPRGEVEEHLTKHLFPIADQDDNPARRAIVSAMAKLGTQGTLPTLHAILDKLTPRAAAAQHFSEGLDPFTSMKGASTVAFVDLLHEAIAAIEARSLACSTTDRPSDSDGIDRSDANRWLNKAHGYQGIEPEVALNYVRKGAEALAKSWYRSLDLHQGDGKHPGSMMLEELTKALEKARAPGALVRLLKSFQPLTGFSAHDQDGQNFQVTSDMAGPMIDLLERAIDYKRTAPPGI